MRFSVIFILLKALFVFTKKQQDTKALYHGSSSTIYLHIQYTSSASFENSSPSPDRSKNPFVVGFHHKRL